MEAEVRAFGERTGLETVMIRPGNIYGFERPDRTCKGVTAAFLNAVDHGLPFTLIHGGSTLRDFLSMSTMSQEQLLSRPQQSREGSCGMSVRGSAPQLSIG